MHRVQLRTQYPKPFRLQRLFFGREPQNLVLLNVCNGLLHENKSEIFFCDAENGGENGQEFGAESSE
jgi:hypothetical protein